jgi:hypothetical protein
MDIYLITEYLRKSVCKGINHLDPYARKGEIAVS